MSPGTLWGVVVSVSLAAGASLLSVLQEGDLARDST